MALCELRLSCSESAFFRILHVLNIHWTLNLHVRELFKLPEYFVKYFDDFDFVMLFKEFSINPYNVAVSRIVSDVFASGAP